MRRKGCDVDGWVIVDKPNGMGSTPVVGKIKRLFCANKVGHAGTLDPFATGVLPIALGVGTKTIPFIQDAEKEYIFTLCFGKTTDTLDTEGTVVQEGLPVPSVEDVQGILGNFIGDITQVPPAYSAIKIDGKRAYDLARQGQDVVIPERRVTIKELEFLRQESPESVSIRVVCSKGTYVRTLGQDIARALGTVGYLTALRRTRVGTYCIENAFGLEKIEKIVHSVPHMEDISRQESVLQNVENAEKEGVLLSIESALVGIPVLTVASERVRKVQNGLAERGLHVEVYREGEIVVLHSETHILGLGEKRNQEIKPIRIFQNPVPKKGN